MVLLAWNRIRRVRERKLASPILSLYLTRLAHSYCLLLYLVNKNRMVFLFRLKNFLRLSCLSPCLIYI